MLDSDNAAFIQSGVSISLAACGPDHLPSISRGLGCKVLADGRQVGVFFRRARSLDLLENIGSSGRLANVFSLPSSNRAVQLKSTDAQVVPFDPADLACAFLSSPTLAESQDAMVKRGAKLVMVGGCMDCHTPFRRGAGGPEKDLARGLSGHPAELKLPTPPLLKAEWNWAGSATMTAFVGPWGISYAANLTPDRETGIGNWKEKDFIQALRTGKHVGVARPIQPPMPWQTLAGLPEKDLQVIFAYLMAQPAVKNKVPDYVPNIVPAQAGSRAPHS